MPKIAGYINYIPRREREDRIDPADVLNVYRADPSGKHGGKDGMETLPNKISYSDVVELAHSLRSAGKYGMPPLSSEQLANRILLEGRGDAGANEYNTNNKRAAALYQQLQSEVPQGLRSTGPTFAAAYLDKSEVAKRLNIPVDKAWIGTGRVTKNYGGDEYAARGAAHSAVNPAASPKNAELMQLIEQVRNGTAPQSVLDRGWIQAREAAGKTIGAPVGTDDLFDKGLADERGYKDKVAGMVAQDPNAMKLLPHVPPQVLRVNAENRARQEIGVPTKPYGTAMVPDKSIPEGLRTPTSQERTDADILGSMPSVRDAMDTAAGRSKTQTKPSMFDRALTGLRNFF